MKRIALAALVSLSATLSVAQAADVPAVNCGAVPEYPGRLGSDTQKRTFDKAYKVYDACIRAYVEERKNSIKANEAAAQKAIDDFNVLVSKMRADSGASTDSKAPEVKKDAPGTYK